MNKRYIILFLIIIVLGGLFFWLSTSRNSYNWNEYYDETIDQPYGTMFLFELLKTYFPNEAFNIIENGVAQDLKFDAQSQSNYIFVGEAMLLDSMDLDKLIDFVEAGNTALISSKTIPNELMEEVYEDDCTEYNEWKPYDYANLGDSVSVGLLHPDLVLNDILDYQFVVRNIPFEYNWNFFDESLICEENYYGLLPMGYLDLGQDTVINFSKLQYGAGEFLLHTNPLLFTNYNLESDTQIVYLENVLAHLKPGSIYWDGYSHISEQLGRRMNNQAPQRSLNSKSPLSYILSQASLSWAWYLLIASGILFLVFRSKRRQKVIAVLDPNRNTSFEFLSTVGRLYFLQNNHRQLALLKIRLLKNYIRNRYGISIKEEYPSELLKQISNKSSVAQEVVDKIFLVSKNIKDSSFVSENTLIDFHQLVDEFYKNSK